MTDSIEDVTDSIEDMVQPSLSRDSGAAKDGPDNSNELVTNELLNMLASMFTHSIKLNSLSSKGRHFGCLDDS